MLTDLDMTAIKKLVKITDPKERGHATQEAPGLSGGMVGSGQSLFLWFPWEGVGEPG